MDKVDYQRLIVYMSRGLSSLTIQELDDYYDLLELHLLEIDQDLQARTK